MTGWSACRTVVWKSISFTVTGFAIAKESSQELLLACTAPGRAANSSV